jgi:hypothetical protein
MVLTLRVDYENYEIKILKIILYTNFSYVENKGRCRHFYNKKLFSTLAAIDNS